MGALANLANSCLVSGEIEKVIELGEKALTIAERTLGETNPETLKITMNLAQVRRREE